MNWLACTLPAALVGCTLLTPLDQLGKAGGADAGAEAGGDAGGDAACSPNLLTDGANCGRCGHDCLGAACESGTCAPVVLASTLAGGGGIAVDASFVYFTLYFGPKIAKCPLSGCGVTPTVLGGSETGPNDVKVNATTLFWASEGTGTNGGTIRHCALPNCATQPVLANGTVTEWVAIDATHFYWTSAADGFVRSCPLAGCSGAPVNIATGQTVPWGLTVDSTSIYFTVWNGSFGAPAQNGGAIRKCPLAGCAGAPVTLASMENQPWQVVVDAEYAYWTGFKDGSVKRCALSGCNNAPTVIASGEAGPSGIAVDATSVYWTDYVGGTVRACAKEGCSVRSAVIAKGQNHPNNIALDDAYVYFTTFGTETAGANDGTVVKVAK